MKNIIISILATHIIVNMSFWDYADMIDKCLVFLAIMVSIFVVVDKIDECITHWIRRRNLQKRRAKRFSLEVIDLTKGRAS